MRRRVITSGLAVILLAALMAAGGCDRARRPAEPAGAVRSGRPVVIGLAVDGRQGGVAGARPLVEVAVGNGRRVPVVLDTGSVGLHIYADAVRRGPGSGVVLTRRADSISYVDGTHQSGVVARAKITIGSVTTPEAAAFGLIESVGCLPARPRCPARGGAAGAERRGSYGVMGVGLRRARVDNPLRHLAAPYSSAWTIALAGSAGTLTLGTPEPRHADAVLALPHAGSSGAAAPAFADATDVCWTVGPLSRACEPTLLDSGDYGMQFFGGALGQALTTAASTYIPPGTPISASLPGAGAPFWTFLAGRAKSANTAQAHRSGSGRVNAAVQAFFAFRIRYDALRGRISLLRR